MLVCTSKMLYTVHFFFKRISKNACINIQIDTYMRHSTSDAPIIKIFIDMEVYMCARTLQSPWYMDRHVLVDSLSLPLCVFLLWKRAIFNIEIRIFHCNSYCCLFVCGWLSFSLLLLAFFLCALLFQTEFVAGNMLFLDTRPIRAYAKANASL